MEMTLTEQQTEHLRNLAEDETRDSETRRNARIILLYGEGTETRDIAAAVDLSESRTRFWRKMFERHGMRMFDEDFTPERRAGAGSAPPRRTEPLLSNEEAARLRGLLDGDIGEELQTRVKLILSYSAGKSTNEIAREIGLSASRTRYWRKAFEREGMGIFTHGERADREYADDRCIADGDGSSDANEAAAKNAATDRTAAAAPRQASKGKKTAGLEPDDSLSAAARKVLHLYFREMLHWGDNPMLGSDPEVVHKMRVSTRRMRSAFDVFEGAFIPKDIRKHRKSLKRLGKVLGRVRDLDVLIMHMESYIETLPPDSAAAFRPLIEEWEQQHARDLEALRAYLAAESYTSFCAAFEDFLLSEKTGSAAEPEVIEGVPKKIGQIAPLMVLGHYTDILAFDAGLDAATLDQLHMLRIQFKKLRYTMEFLVDLLGPQARKVIKQVTDAQDYLGKLQDDQTAMQLITAFTHELDIRQSDRPLSERLNTAPLLTYLAERQTRKHELLTSFGDVWEGFVSKAFRKRLLQILL